MDAITHTDLRAIEYLVIGHITRDITPSGFRLGGTATFSSLTARAMGLSVGIITSCDSQTELENYEQIQVINLPCEQNTTFKNINSDQGRIQYLYNNALPLDPSLVPPVWKKTPIVHLGPVANEVDPSFIDYFPDSLIFITPQGWLRIAATDGMIHPKPWSLPNEILSKVTATVISNEDVQGDEDLISEMALFSKILVVTENKLGARLYWNGDVRHFKAPQEACIDDIGAGDIFAAVFFSRLAETKDPWESARFAVKLAASSVTRRYLDSIPTREEVASTLVEIIK